MSVDKSKNFSLIPEKMTRGLISLLLQLCNSRPHMYANFVLLSVIVAPHNVLTPRISKTHLPIASLNVRELEFN